MLANPPFNVDEVSVSGVEKDRRFNTYGIPRNKSKVKKADAGKETVPNANYLWINLFATSLKPKGRAALVMANSASDARHSEADIRRTLIEKNLIYGMLTLPRTCSIPSRSGSSTRPRPTTASSSLMPGTSSLEFSDEQIQNIAIISQLHKGRREKFMQLVDRYFAAGMERLIENKTRVEPVSAQLLEVLDDDAGKQAVPELVKQWAGLNKLQTRYEQYCDKFPMVGTSRRDVPARAAADGTVAPLNAARTAQRAVPTLNVDAKNKAQHQLRETFDPFFAALHEGLKQLDKTVRQHEQRHAEQPQSNGKRGAIDRKTKALKTALDALHTEVKNAEIFYQHIHWLQERFPRRNTKT